MPGKVVETAIVLADGTTPADFDERITTLEDAPPGSIDDPNQQSYEVASFTLPTGKYVILCNHLILTGSNRLTAEGTSRVGII